MIATVLFDLDGVLVDSRSSIATCMRHALDGAGLAAPDDHVLHAHIGPPIHDSFEALVTRLGGDAGLVPALVERYRERYRDTCIAETPAFPEIPALLADLARHRRLGVVTSKPVAFARPILAALGLARHLAIIEGPSLQARSEAKAVTLARALVALAPPRTETVAMVGDRSHDIAAGRVHGLVTIGVLWGFGTRAELKGAGADAIVATPAELVFAINLLKAAEEG
jgi:phosphoglycolate phosphatase